MLGFYRSNKEKIFLRQIYTFKEKGINLSFLEGKTIEYPSWHSYDGFYGWSKEISQVFSIPEIIVYTELLFPEEDMRYVEAYPLERHRKLWDVISIFPTTPTQRTITWFFEEGYQWVDNKKIMESIDLLIARGAWPRTYKEFNNLRSSTLLEANPKEAVFRMYKCRHLNKYDMALLGARGYVSKKEKQIFMHIVRSNTIYDTEAIMHELFSLKREAINQINLRYFRKCYASCITLSDLMEAGVKLKDLLPGYTKKERREIVKACSAYPLHAMKTHALRVIFKDRLPEAWLQYINSPEVARWAIEKRGQLSRHRIVHGPGGTTARFEYHLILNKVTPEMLTQGLKTSFRKIWEEVGQQELEITKALAGKKIEFKTLPFPEKWEGKITPLTNSVELFKEGEEMSHCVGGSIYQEACIRGISYIYHVGNPAPEGATFEISNFDREEYELCQIYAYKDSQPKEKERAMAREFVKDINELIGERG